MSAPEKSTVSALTTRAEDEALGQTLGRYKLLEKIGEGGCGVVYVAEQKEPVRRKVALKIIKLGMDTKMVVARFEAERQALAMMDHPNIARVLDAGASDSGRPYFVMELVRGVRITDYCDQANIPTRGRIELFVKVCQAIQHAHQKGIIHRDIKPSNILVSLHDGVPVPKVIDFGIAKATQGELTDKTVHTQFQQFIGTPAYMSPEQAEMSGLDIDTRSDIYSLGVLLYELLTGRTPFDPNELMRSGIDGMRKTIREKEPARPSTRLAALQGEERTTTATRHALEIPRLIHLLKGDLDWIVMKCLEKDRTRRYETANGLGADLNRFLHNELVLARPPSASYRLQKAFRRNKLAFVAAAAITAALLLGLIASIWQAARAKRAELTATQTRKDAERLSGFLLEDLYAELAPIGQYDTIARLTEQAVAYYDGLAPSRRTRETRKNRAMAQARLALVTAHRGNTQAAVSMAQEAIATLEQMHHEGDQTDGTLYSLALAFQAQCWAYVSDLNIESQAVPLRRAVDLLRPLVGSQKLSNRVKLEYANILNMLSHELPAEQGVAMCEEALHLLDGIGASDLSDLSAGSAWGDTADSEAREALTLGRVEEAERLEKAVLALAEKIVTRRPGDLRARQDLFFAPDVLGLVALSRFRYDAALQFETQCLRATEDYMRFNPSDATGPASHLLTDYTIASIQFELGHVEDSLHTLRTATRLVTEHGEANNQFTMPTAALLWTAISRREAQNGRRGAADSALQESRRALDTIAVKGRMPERTKEGWMEFSANAERQMRLAFDENARAFTMAQDALVRLSRLKENEHNAEVAAGFLFLQRQTLTASAEAALKLGRWSDAENAARALIALPMQILGDLTKRSYIEEGGDREWGRVLLAQSVAAQGRKEEALTMIEPVVAQYRAIQTQGAGHLSFRQHFARALYVRTLAEPSQKPERRDTLAEAARLLHDLPPEAQQLSDTRALLALIAAAGKQ